MIYPRDVVLMLFQVRVLLSLATGLALIWMMAVVMLRPFSKELSDIVVVVNYVGFFSSGI